MEQSTRKPLTVRPARPALPPPGRRFTAPIGVVYALVTALLVGAPLAVVVALNIDANSENTFALLNQRAVLLTDAIESSIRRHLEEAAGAVDSIAAEHGSGAVDLTDHASAAAHLRGAIDALPQVEALIVYSGGQRLAGVARRPAGSIDNIPPGLVKNPVILRAIARVEASGEAGWGDLVYRDGRVYANYAAPLARNGRHDGLVAAAVSITTLSEIVTDIANKYDTTAFILDGTDRVLAHPNLVSGHPELSQESPTVPLTRIGDPILAAFPEREVLVDFAAAGAEGVEVSSVDIGDQQFILIYRTVEGFGPRPWIIGAHFAARDVGNEINRLARVAAISLGALVAAVAIAFLIARLMSRPIRRFTSRAALITDLELDNIDRLPPSRIRELDEGATAFNAMLDGLRAFAAYVPKTLVTRLVHSGIKSTTRSVERELTIMFTDIVGFTSLAERLSVGEVAHLLNHHFRILARIIESRGGTVDKFIGDEMMAFWGAPEPLDDHAGSACRAALEIAEAMHADNERRQREGGPQVRLRIGIHTGPVIVGNVGGGGRINYTVIGDSVNVAQRLQDLGRVVAPADEVTILVSAETAARAGAAFVTEKAGERALRGRKAETVALRLVAMAG